MANQNTTERGGSGNFASDREKASDAGRKGGQQHNATQDKSPSEEGGQRGGGSNFANDPEKAREAGRKGGEHSHGGR